ncbi:CLUMA_CG013345, isoform A [Clunio marinus]|uniref:CLUMA_CG013345, isoform A n=1 Tax=Clunio marinus TaxID=568069 RepID=A0A1J1IIL5_9DIPT|nr:CLUMA_CG013345, isoform A [Clunio marinus]
MTLSVSQNIININRIFKKVSVLRNNLKHSGVCERLLNVKLFNINLVNVTDMIQRLVFGLLLVNYATCRTSRSFRDFPETARLSQAQYPSYNIISPNGPGTYAFGYEIEDPATGNVQFRDEEKLRNGTVRGSYGVLLPDDTLHITRYIADRFGYRASSDTKKIKSPLKLELQLQPSFAPKPYPLVQQNIAPTHMINLPSNQNPNLPESVSSPNNPTDYQQDNVLLNPNFYKYHDALSDEQNANAIYQQQLMQAQLSPYGFLRQSSFSQQNRPTNTWYGNNNYQNDQTQGPVMSFLSNLAMNNPLANFFNSFQQQPQNVAAQNDQYQTQNQNPIQTLITNLNPFNLFSNNNRPQSMSVQSDYISPTSSPSNVMLSGNIDSSVFSNGNLPNYMYPTNSNSNYMTPTYGTGVVSAYNQYPNYNSPNMYNLNANHGQFPINRPYNGYQVGPAPINVRPNSYLSQTQAYPYVYSNQNSYRPIVSAPITPNPNIVYTKKTNTKSQKKKNKDKVDVDDTESDWFQDFLDKRKEASLSLSGSKQTTTKKMKSKDDNTSDFDDYFR